MVADQKAIYIRDIMSKHSPKCQHPRYWLQNSKSSIFAENAVTTDSKTNGIITIQSDYTCPMFDDYVIKKNLKTDLAYGAWFKSMSIVNTNLTFSPSTLLHTYSFVGIPPCKSFIRPTWSFINTSAHRCQVLILGSRIVFIYLTKYRYIQTS